jgi:uncharacterized membrane protein
MVDPIDTNQRLRMPERYHGVRTMRRALLTLVLGFLAFKGVQFYAGTIEHFGFDYSEANYGRFWPNRLWLVLHIVGGTAALFAGPFQLWSGFRDRQVEVHRRTGWVYIAGVALGGASAFYLSLFSQPRSFGVALFGLGVAWWVTAVAALLAIKQYRIDVHKRWMVRSYAVTLSFVTFRVLIEWPVWSFAGDHWLAVALWLSWLGPLALTETLLLPATTAHRRASS